MRARPGWLHAPAPTIRLRMTALYGLVFLVTGAVLLTIGYGLVRHNLNAPGDYRRELQRLGIVPQGFFGQPPAFAPGSTVRVSPMRSGPSCAPTRCIACSSSTSWPSGR